MCKGFGFVMFQDPADATRAQMSLIESGFAITFAKISRPSKAMGSSKGKASQIQEDPTNIYFSNLPMSFDEVKLQSLLMPYGRVTSCRILRDHNTQASRGVGFARMGERGACEKVVQEFCGRVLEPGAEPLQCKFADCPSHRTKPLRFPQQEFALDVFDTTQQPNLAQNMFIQNGLVPVYNTPYYSMPQFQTLQTAPVNTPTLTTPPLESTTAFALQSPTPQRQPQQHQQHQQHQQLRTSQGQLLSFNQIPQQTYTMNTMNHQLRHSHGGYVTSNMVIVPQPLSPTQQYLHNEYGGFIPVCTNTMPTTGISGQEETKIYAKETKRKTKKETLAPMI